MTEHGEPLVRTAGVGSSTWLTLNRPASLNALNAQLLDELEAGLERALADPAVRVVVLVGAGDRAFSAGADLDELTGLDSAAALAVLSRGHRLFRRIESAPKPVVAAVDGYALGGGFELALSCHLMVATQRARFGLPEATLGLIPGYGGTQRLTEAVGRRLALQVMLTGAKLTAQQMWEAGVLAAAPVEPEALADTVDTLVHELTRAGADATRAVLAAVVGSTPTLPLANEAGLGAIAISSDAGQAGIRAFRERSAK
ncbi:enoyl-CoA hydratase-related protein [Sporichthya brevicatena]|uniref:Enoyl-CoA hydratase-related protein n=1 Tax=Sporichthya brevicatena TaxID=171442 RepID=A0ABP3S5J7_9ACTN